MSQSSSATARKHVPHILPLKVYFMVAVGLLLLTVVTVRVSYFDFGTWNLIVAMSIASIKASLVALFFMHLKYDERFNSVIFVSSLAFLGVFFALTLADTVDRGAVDPIKERAILPVPARPEFMERYGIDTGLAADSTAADSAGVQGGAAPDSTEDAGATGHEGGSAGGH
jgi:cytochrome c oxidase subunit 4